jgi:hypothetical protein
MVAWCTKPGRGTRLIPNNALQGVQFMKTPDYVQVVGFVDQSKINLLQDDSGGRWTPMVLISYVPFTLRDIEKPTYILTAWQPPRWAVLLQFLEHR